MIPTLANVLASRVKGASENPTPYVEMVSIMRDQSTRIQELEQSLEHMKEVEEVRRHRDHRHRSRDDDEVCHCRPCHHSEEPHLRSDY